MLQDIRIRQRDYLIKIVRILTQELDPAQLLWQVIQIAVEIIGGESGFIALYSEDTGWQVCTNFAMQEAPYRYIEAYLEKNIDTSLTPMEQTDLLVRRLRSILDFNIADGLALPLNTRGKFIGVIVVFRSYALNFSVNERSILKAFADQAAIAINNSLLYTENLKEKNRLNAVIDSAADGIIVMSISHRIERVNSALMKMLNLPGHLDKVLYHEELIHFEKIDSGMELDEGEAGGWPLNRDTKLTVQGRIHKFQSSVTVPVSITYTPVMNEENHLVNIIAMVRDISKFIEADNLKNTFISTISHELKTPVAIIKGYASTLNMEDADWDEAIIRDSLSVIEEEADHLTAMINDLLDASRLNSGSLKMNCVDFDLPALCKHLVKRMQKQTTTNQIICDFPPDFPILNADDNRISQVLTNLISNAMKYAPNGEIRIKGKVNGNEVIISVLDEGPGLSPEDMQHVFERFYRSRSTANNVKGTGLGLFLCDAIVRGHGGRISVQNRADRSGCCFSFTLPLTNGSSAELNFSS